MTKQTRAISNDMAQLAEDARALIAATADMAEEKVGAARKRLAGALERGKDIYGSACDLEADSERAIRNAVHEHLCPIIAVGVGVGAILTYLAARHCTHKRD